MLARFVPLVTLFTLIGLVAEPRPVLQAQQGGSGGPPLLVRIRSIDSLVTDAKWLAKLAGEEESGAQLEGLLQTFIGDKAIDTKKPIGLYGAIGPNGLDSSLVVMVPIIQQKEFLKLLDQHNVAVTPDKQDAGLHGYTAGDGAVKGFLRFANGYAYITNDKAATVDAKRILGPSAVFDPKDQAAVSVVLRIGDVPKQLKETFLTKFKEELDKAKEQKAENETPVQAKLKVAMLDGFLQQARSLLNDGNELALRFDIDRKAGELSADLSLSSQPKSKLEATIAGLQAKSVTAGTVGSDSAINFTVNVSLSEGLKKAFGPAIDEGIAAAIKEQQERKTGNPEAAEKFLKVLTPTLKAGELDFAVTMRGPNAANKYALLAGMKVRDGLAVENAFRDIVKLLKPEEQAKIKLDAEKIGTVNVHRFEVTRDFDKRARDMFGEGPLFIAVKPEAVYFTVGDNALDVLKEALAAQPTSASIVQLEMSLRRFVALLAAEQPEAAKAAEQVFKNSDGDKVRMVLQGGKSLKARFSMQADVVRFFIEAGKLKKDGADK
ncbi:MAG: hypothetical protein JNM56_09200 [Planctomycetia bacterium]|nr:hypothetical protein [Planctomycetia bacterium]